MAAAAKPDKLPFRQCAAKQVLAGPERAESGLMAARYGNRSASDKAVTHALRSAPALKTTGTGLRLTTGSGNRTNRNPFPWGILAVQIEKFP